MPAFLGVLFLALTWLVLPVTPQLQAGQGQGLSYSLLVQPIPVPARFGSQLLSPQVSGGRTLQTWALRSVISCPVTSSVASRDARVGPALVPALPPSLPFVPLSRIHTTGALPSGGEQETKADREVLAQLIPQTHLVRGPGCPREPLAEPSLPSTTQRGGRAGLGLSSACQSHGSVLTHFIWRVNNLEPGWHQPWELQCSHPAVAVLAAGAPRAFQNCSSCLGPGALLLSLSSRTFSVPLDIP